jgi:hypothetical protein
MLDFFRRYQKIFFIVIATVVISSFVFFGTSGVIDNHTQARTDRVIGKAIDGSDLKLLEISSLARFIGTDQDDMFNVYRNAPPNLLNDGVIRQDILKAGVADVLVQGNIDVLQSELEQRWQRIKTYQAYEHPETPLLSAKAVWQRFNPGVNAHWSFLQSESAFTASSFSHLAELYLLQDQLPSEWLRRILMMQEQQYHWLHADPRLREGDFSLFGFHSVTDWFGKNFVDLTAEFIHNAAITAEEKGYKVTLKEAKADLQRNFGEALRKIEAAKIEAKLNYKDQLRVLGLTETEAATLWRKVLLFRRYFADLGNSVFLDKLAHTEFSAVAGEKAVVDVYQWPSILKFHTAYNLYAFETYLKKVAAGDRKESLALPLTFKSIEEVEKGAPELVATRYRAKVFAIDKREIALKAPLKDVWAFETEESVWSRLKAQFPGLQNAPAKTAEERFAALEKILPNERPKIDSFARQLLLEKHPEWITAALDAAQGEVKELSLSGGKIELPYVDDPAKLGTLFTEILLAPETALAELHQFASKNAFFRFENIEKVSDAQIKTFAEAMQDRSLVKMVDRALEAEFPKVRSSLPADKADKPFSEVKEEIADHLLAHLKKQIQSATEAMEGSIVARRMGFVAAKALSDLQQNPDDPRWIGSEDENPLSAQFKMQRTEKEISRTAKEDWMSKESFMLIPNQWSPVHVADDGSVVFMYLKARQGGKEPILEPLVAGRQVLSTDIQRVLAEKILTTMHQKHAVVIPLQPEGE